MGTIYKPGTKLCLGYQEHSGKTAYRSSVLGVGCLVALLPALSSCSDCGCAKGGVAATEKGIKAVSVQSGEPSGQTPGTDSEGFLYAPFSKSAAEVPKRFRSRLPSTVAEFDGDWASFPPRGQASAALCSGDESMFARWLDAVELAAKRGPIGEELRERFVGLAEFCGADKTIFCERVVKRLPTASTKAAPILRGALTECDGPDARSALEAAADDQLVIEWYFNRHTRLPAMSERFKKAARRTVARQSGRQLRTLGVTLGQFDDPLLVSFVEELQRSANEEGRAWLALGMRDQSTSVGRGLWVSACAHPIVGRDPMCSAPSTFVSSAGRESAKALSEQIRSNGFDGRAWLREHPGRSVELTTALRDCVTSGDARCLVAWAAFDREGAASFVASAPEGARSGDFGLIAANLRAFPTTASLDSAGADLGLVTAPGAAVVPADTTDEQPVVTLVDKLRAAGRLHVFDVETGSFPNQHDVLLRELAAYAGTDLRGVAFEEQPPQTRETNETVDQIGPYQLRAYAGGQRYEIQAANNGDWYDVAAVVGLLNSVLRDLGSPFRYVVVESDAQMASVLGGPREALLRASKAGLLRFENANAAMGHGKAFEKQALDQLQKP